jgi:hypothetical protein
MYCRSVLSLRDSSVEHKISDWYAAATQCITPYIILYVRIWSDAGTGKCRPACSTSLNPCFDLIPHATRHLQAQQSSRQNPTYLPRPRDGRRHAGGVQPNPAHPTRPCCSSSTDIIAGEQLRVATNGTIAKKKYSKHWVQIKGHLHKKITFCEKKTHEK